jgi:hypothetical protein
MSDREAGKKEEKKQSEAVEEQDLFDALDRSQYRDLRVFWINDHFRSVDQNFHSQPLHVLQNRIKRMRMSNEELFFPLCGPSHSRTESKNCGVRASANSTLLRAALRLKRADAGLR